MQGCGNDYVYVNCFEEDLPEAARPEFSRKVSDRHFGAGSDGLICICPSHKADFKMDMYNADGSQAQMCGNGIRCVAKYVYERGMTDKTVIDVETGAGVKTLWLNLEDGVVESVRVCMGTPVFEPAQIPVDASGTAFIDQPIEVGGNMWNVTAVSVGNPPLRRVRRRRGVDGFAEHRPALREPSALPGAREHRVRPGHRPQ